MKLLSRFAALWTVCVICAVCALAAPGLLAAQESLWTSLGPFGGQIDSLTADPSRPGVVYATETGLGVFRSADAGASWTAVFGGEVLGNVAVDPAAPSVLYVAASPSGVWKSVDSGAHWSPAGRGLPANLGPFPIVEVDPARPNRVYLGSSRGVWRSVNGGASWQSANTGFPAAPSLPAVTAIAAVRRPVATAFAGTAAGLFRTTNGGNSWQRLGRGLPAGVAGTAVTSLAVSPSDPQTLYVLFEGGGLFRTRNGGNSWQPATRPPGSQPVTSLVVDPRSPATLYAGLLNGQVLRSMDGASRWGAAGRLPGSPSPAVALEPDPFTRRRLYAGLPQGAVPGGVFRSDDGGSTWQRRSEGLSGLGATSLAVDPSDPAQLWTGGDSYLFRSANGGRRWSRLATPGGFLFPEPGQIGVGAASAVFVRTFQPLPIGRSTLFRTENDGASWAQVFGPLERFQSFLQYRIAPSDPETLYALASLEPAQPRYSLLRSTDSGGSWQTRASGLLLGCGVGELVVAPSSAEVLYATGAASVPPQSCAGPSSQVLRSRDGGATWTDVSAGLPARGFVDRATVDPGDPDVVYVSFEITGFSPTGGVWKSTDGGATWRQAGTELAGRSISYLLATAVPGRVYAALAGGRVFRSDDGGEHWEDATGRLVTRGIYELVADPSDPDRIYAATWNGVWRLDEN